MSKMDYLEPRECSHGRDRDETCEDCRAAHARSTEGTMSNETSKHTPGQEMRKRDLRIFAMGYAAAMKEEAEAPSDYAHRKANDVARFLQVNAHTHGLYTALKADWDAADREA